MRNLGKMRGLSLSYNAFAQKFARFGVTFDVMLARMTAGFHPIDTPCALTASRTGQRSVDPSPKARIAPIVCGPCLFSSFLGELARLALSFAEAVNLCGFHFSNAAFFGRLKASATKQRAVKSCANHFLHSPSSLSQPFLAVWTMTQSAQLQAALPVRLWPTRLVAVLLLARLAALLLARCATTHAFVTKTQFTDLALSAPFGGLGRIEKKGFRAGQLGSLFSCA